VELRSVFLRHLEDTATLYPLATPRRCRHIDRHSKIGYVTPEDRNRGNDIKKFEARNRTMGKVFKKYPERVKGKIRKWVRTEVVYINKSVVSLIA